MTLTSAIEASRWTVLLDIRHPLAYLALHPTITLSHQLGVEINWLPLTAPTLRPPSTPAPDDDRGILHRRHRARAIAREIETYASAQGLVLREFYRDADASAFGLGWLWLRDRCPERVESYLAETFRAYWALELDPSSDEAIATQIDASGGDARGFTSWCASAGQDAARALAGELRERGLQGVPCSLVEEEVLLGRQHLPMIRWILEGRRGAVPI